MRVTDSYMSQSFLRNLSQNMKNVQKYNNQLSSNKEVSKPSDNPLLVSKIIDLNGSISQNEQYKTTINDAIDWTNVQDSALSNASGSLQRIRTLIQASANDSMNHSDRMVNKEEILSEVNTLVDALNTNFGGRYIFSGKNTTEVPFEVETDADGNITGLVYHGTTDQVDADGNRVPVNGNLSRAVAPGVTIELKTDGRYLLNEQGADADPDNLGTFFKDLMTALDNDDTEALAGGLLARVDKEIDNIVTNRAETGAIYNRLDSTKSRNETEKLNLQSMLSEKQDIDLAEKYMQYMMETVAYQSALAMGTKVLQTNILNYL